MQSEDATFLQQLGMMWYVDDIMWYVVWDDAHDVLYNMIYMMWCMIWFLWCDV
jgi:hypothetical protein